MTANVQLEFFEGPLDLLLHLIKKSEVSITDIPIAAITVHSTTLPPSPRPRVG